MTVQTGAFLPSFLLILLTKYYVLIILWAFTYVPIAVQAVSPSAGSQGSPEFGDVWGAIHHPRHADHTVLYVYVYVRIYTVYMRIYTVHIRVYAVWGWSGDSVCRPMSPHRPCCCINHPHLSIFWSYRSSRTKINVVKKHREVENTRNQKSIMAQHVGSSNHTDHP